MQGKDPLTQSKDTQTLCEGTHTQKKAKTHRDTLTQYENKAKTHLT